MGHKPQDLGYRPPLVNGMMPLDEFRLRRRLELNMYAYDQTGTQSRFAQEQIDRIVHLTCVVNQQLIMGYAIEIEEQGMSNEYEHNHETRMLIDLWCKTHFGDLTLKEFLTCATV